MEIPEGDVWVVDTSSIINVKELIKPKHRLSVFLALTNELFNGRLVFPREVVHELSNGVKDGKSDSPLVWAKQSSRLGCRLGPCFDKLTKVMNNPTARLTSDPNQTTGADDADPHVLATALEVVALGGTAIVVTQESRKHPPQVPLNVAAGSLGLPSINLYALLIGIGAWVDEFRNP